MQNSVNHAPGLKCKVCPRLLSEVIKRLVFLVVTTGQPRETTVSQAGIHWNQTLSTPPLHVYFRAA